MILNVSRLLRPSTVRSPWVSKAPVREELFGIERLEQHARTLADAQPVTTTPARVPSLHAQLDHNAATLLTVGPSTFTCRVVRIAADALPVSNGSTVRFPIQQSKCPASRERSKVAGQGEPGRLGFV